MKTYKHNGLTVTEFSPKSLRLQWWDAAKNSVPANSFSGGFFGKFADIDPKKPNYTLPVANILCDAGNIGVQQTADIRSWGGTVEKKVSLNCNQNAKDNRYKGKKVSTFIIDTSGKASVQEIDKIPANARYAMSGVPVIRDGSDVSWTKFAVPQGWQGDPMYGTKRNWLGIKCDCTCVLISGATTTGNYISTSELYGKVKTLGIRDLIALDGGGSYINKVGGTDKTAENRRINNIGVIAE
jgi:hypothetical protein